MEAYKTSDTDKPIPNISKEDILRKYSIWSWAFWLVNLLNTGIFKQDWYSFDLRKDLKKYRAKSRDWQIREYYAPSIKLLRDNVTYGSTLEITEIKWK